MADLACAVYTDPDLLIKPEAADLRVFWFPGHSFWRNLVADFVNNEFLLEERIPLIVLAHINVPKPPTDHLHHSNQRDSEEHKTEDSNNHEGCSTLPDLLVHRAPQVEVVPPQLPYHRMVDGEPSQHNAPPRFPARVAWVAVWPGRSVTMGSSRRFSFESVSWFPVASRSAAWRTAGRHPG